MTGSRPFPHDARLVAQGIELWRGRRRLLTGFGFSLSAGEFARLTGPNGAGKTSLIRALLGLAALEAGSIEWCGAAIPSGDFRGASAYVGHNNGVTPDLSAHENLRYAASLMPVVPRMGIPAALEHVGLRGVGQRPAATFSAGQKRRLALARLLLSPAQLWVLDEPLTSLDAEGVAMLERLLTVHLDHGGMVVAATHQPLQATGHAPLELQLGAPA